MGLISLLVAALVSIACVATSAQRMRRLNHGIGSNFERWALELRSVVATAPSRAAAIAELNERTADLSRELGVGAGLPQAMARIALAAGTACAVLAIAGSIQVSSERALAEASIAFVVGLAGAGGSALIGRMADARVAETRERWVTLRRTLERSLPRLN